ncbi:PIG-L family deacetylase [Microlunatus endophyticus]|uniref:PIG-L family deacetylase n=1 Tax=Microlunatus endophyticus TaxID=1716077 RepID=A0A917SH01_9ACTN|nr:PIG-L family deacetylase [Microlunatus endophyticus]GGL76917.1 PIG-L family deacetylase [Microlunatus endophyticus]
MVSFDARDPGTSNQEWLRSPRLAAAPQVDLGRFDRIIVLAAHPDDETVGAGGLIAAAVRSGIAVDVIMVTDGAASHPAIDPAELIMTRAREARAATAALADGHHDRIRLELLGRPDGAVREERELIMKLLAARLEGSAGTRSLVVSTWTGDGHRDHRVLGEVAVELAAAHRLELWQYPIWMWHWADPDHPDVDWDRIARLVLEPVARECKQAAIRCYGSQITVGPAGEPPMLHRRFLANFDRDFETFLPA